MTCEFRAHCSKALHSPVSLPDAVQASPSTHVPGLDEHAIFGPNVLLLQSCAHCRKALHNPVLLPDAVHAFHLTHVPGLDEHAIFEPNALLLQSSVSASVGKGVVVSGGVGASVVGP